MDLVVDEGSGGNVFVSWITEGSFPTIGWKDSFTKVDIL